MTFVFFVENCTLIQFLYIQQIYVREDYLMSENTLMLYLNISLSLFSRSLGGAEYTEALCNMEKQSPELNGGALFSDPRLVANGFKIHLTPGTLGIKFQVVTLS